MSKGRGRGRGRGMTDRGGRPPASAGIPRDIATESTKAVNPKPINQVKKLEATIAPQPTSPAKINPSKREINPPEKQLADNTLIPSNKAIRSRPHSKRGTQRPAPKAPDLKVDTSDATTKDKPPLTAAEATSVTPSRLGHSRRGSRHRLRTPTTPGKGHASEIEKVGSRGIACEVDDQ